MLYPVTVAYVKLVGSFQARVIDDRVEDSSVGAEGVAGTEAHIK